MNLKKIFFLSCSLELGTKEGKKFPHSPILHYAFSSWIEKTMTKTIHCLGKTDLFYNRMGLCGNFTQKKPCLRRLQKKKFINECTSAQNTFLHSKAILLDQNQTQSWNESTFHSACEWKHIWSQNSWPSRIKGFS